MDQLLILALDASNFILAIILVAMGLVIIFGLMNEPHDMGQSSWKSISQTSVDAIRKIDKWTTLLVAGDH